MSHDISDSDRTVAQYIADSAYELLDSERLASAIRNALREYDDPARPLVAVVRDVANSLRELQRQVQEREEALRPFALPPGWHFIAYNKTGSTGCPFNAGEVERVRAILAPKEQTP